MRRFTKKIVFAILFFFFSCCSFAQTFYHHNNFWSRVFLSDQLTKKIKAEVLLQSRWQNGEKKSLNIFDHHQLKSYWLWLHYDLSDKTRVSVTPFCYFATKPLVVNPVDKFARPVKEYRWAVRIDNQQRLSAFTYINRYGLEYRLRDINSEGVYEPNWRARYMFRFHFPIEVSWLRERSLQFITYEEVQLQFGKAVKANPNVFDQNRLYAGFNYQLFKNIRTELGYLNVIQQKRSGTEFDLQNALFFVVHFDNVFSQFSDK